MLVFILGSCVPFFLLFFVNLFLVMKSHFLHFIYCYRFLLLLRNCCFYVADILLSFFITIVEDNESFSFSCFAFCFNFVVCNFLMSAYFCPHSVFNSEYLIEFVCLKSDLINNSDN